MVDDHEIWYQAVLKVGTPDTDVQSIVFFRTTAIGPPRRLIQDVLLDIARHPDIAKKFVRTEGGDTFVYSGGAVVLWPRDEQREVSYEELERMVAISCP